MHQLSSYYNAFVQIEFDLTKSKHLLQDINACSKKHGKTVNKLTFL